MAEDENVPNPIVAQVLNKLPSRRMRIVAFEPEWAAAAVGSNRRDGTGNGQGGLLNMLDLLVDGTAQVRRLLIVCMGKDFPSTDALIHAASRPW
jgi:ribonuclease VapC